MERRAPTKHFSVKRGKRAMKRLSTSRRDFLHLSAGAAIFGASSTLFSRAASAEKFDALVQTAKKAGEDRVVMAGGTGAYVDLVKKYFYSPFTEATGIKVDIIGGSYGERIAKLKAMDVAKAVEWDAIAMSVDSLTPETRSLLRDIG